MNVPKAPIRKYEMTPTWFEAMDSRYESLRNQKRRSPAESQELERLDAILKLEVKSCPCCGRDDLYVGVISGMTYGVECQNNRCRLTLERRTPARYPRGVQSLNELKIYVLTQAVKAWNRRISKKS